MRTGIAVGLIIAGVFISGFYAAHEKNITVDVPVAVYAGDTLWSICSREAEIAGDNRDIREIIFETAAANGIKDGGAIFAGQKLIVRVQKHE